MRITSPFQNYALHPDGVRIAMFPPTRTTADAGRGPRFAYVQNFFDELRRLAPPR
jgi:hypothetical protein